MDIISVLWITRHGGALCCIRDSPAGAFPLKKLSCEGGKRDCSYLFSRVLYTLGTCIKLYYYYRFFFSPRVNSILGVESSNPSRHAPVCTCSDILRLARRHRSKKKMRRDFRKKKKKNCHTAGRWAIVREKLTFILSILSRINVEFISSVKLSFLPIRKSPKQNVFRFSIVKFEHIHHKLLRNRFEKLFL